MANLDEALRDWFDRQTPDAADVERLCASIRRQVAEETDDPTDEQTDDAPVERNLPASLRRANGPLRTWATLAAVACLFLILGLVVGRNALPPAGPAGAEVASEPEASALLLKELDRLFEGRWTSIGEVNGRTFVEASDRSDLAVERQPRVAVKLVAVERRENDSEWRVVWQATVVTRSDEWVRVPARVTGRDSVALWAYALPDGAVMVESELALRAAPGIEVSTAKLFPKSEQSHDRTVELWTGRRGDRDVRVLEATELVMF